MGRCLRNFIVRIPPPSSPVQLFIYFFTCKYMNIYISFFVLWLFVLYDSFSLILNIVRMRMWLQAYSLTFFHLLCESPMVPVYKLVAYQQNVRLIPGWVSSASLPLHQFYSCYPSPHSDSLLVITSSMRVCHFTPRIGSSCLGSTDPLRIDSQCISRLSLKTCQCLWKAYRISSERFD